MLLYQCKVLLCNSLFYAWSLFSKFYVQLWSWTCKGLVPLFLIIDGWLFNYACVLILAIEFDYYSCIYAKNNNLYHVCTLASCLYSLHITASLLLYEKIVTYNVCVLLELFHAWHNPVLCVCLFVCVYKLLFDLDMKAGNSCGSGLSCWERCKWRYSSLWSNCTANLAEEYHFCHLLPLPSPVWLKVLCSNMKLHLNSATVTSDGFSQTNTLIPVLCIYLKN